MNYKNISFLHIRLNISAIIYKSITHFELFLCMVLGAGWRSLPTLPPSRDYAVPGLQVDQTFLYWIALATLPKTNWPCKCRSISGLFSAIDLLHQSFILTTLSWLLHLEMSSKLFCFQKTVLIFLDHLLMYVFLNELVNFFLKSLLEFWISWIPSIEYRST